MNELIERLVREAGFNPPALSTSTLLYMEAFAKLVALECMLICRTTPPEPFRPSIEAAHAIRERFGITESEYRK